VFLYYIPLQWARRPMGARGWAADEGPLSNSSVARSLPAFTAGFTSECVGIGHYFRNFPTARYIFTAGFELFGRDHGHLATL
jgi:hypothetical protein